MNESTSATQRAVSNLLEALASRDLLRIQLALSPDCTWQNVPHPPAVGRIAVLAMLAPIVCWSDQVRWDVVSAAYQDGTAWLERADRFWIDGEEHTASCNGVFTADSVSGTISSVRDYVDLGEWRARLGPVFEKLANRAPIDVVARHLQAVDRRDPMAMAADYALDAVLSRGDDELCGWFEIANYFRTVPERLGANELVCSAPSLIATGDVRVTWTLTAANSTTLTGTDVYRVEHGRIAHQAVGLHGPDF